MAARIVCLSAFAVLVSAQSWNTNPTGNQYGAGSNNPYGPSTQNYGQQGQYGAVGGAYGANSYNGAGGGNSIAPFQPVYEWFSLDYNWLDEMTKQQALSNRRFIPENNALSNIKAWRDRIFVTIPRFKEGVPVTLASLPANSFQPSGSPRLDPFPSWQMQEIGNCSALQSVQGIEIDPEGKIWILDSGRTNILDGVAGQPSRCPPKLVIIDLNSVQFGQGGQFGQYPNTGYQPGQPGYNPSGQYPQPGQPGYNQPGSPGYNANQPYNSNQPGSPGYNPNLPNSGYNSNLPGSPGYNQNLPGSPGYNPGLSGSSNYNSNLPGSPGYNPNLPGSSNYNQPGSPGYNPNLNLQPGQPGYNPNLQPGQPGYNANQPYNSQYGQNYPNNLNSQYPQPGQPGYNANNQYPQPGQPGYNANNQYNRPNQYGNQYNQFNNTPRYDQFGNPLPQYGQTGYNQGGYGGFGGLGFSNFRIIKSYNFPTTVATPFGNRLSDIVLDNANGYYAYITDSGDDPGIIVYSFREDRSWKVKDARSMRSDPDVGFVSINNIDVELRGKNIDGLALSPSQGYERTLYFSPLGSYNLYSLPTSVLKNPNLNSDVSSSVVDLGRKQSITDGMTMDSRGNLYFGLLSLNAVGVWNTKHGRFTDSQRILSRDQRSLQWPSSFGIDDMGNLWVITNRFQNYVTGRVNAGEPNYRILKAPLGGRSYQSPADMSAGGGLDQFGRSNTGSNTYDSYGSNYYYGWNSATVSSFSFYALTLSLVLSIFLSR